MIVYKSQGIDWHPQSDSLGVSPLKWTHSTHPFVSGLCCLVESLRQLTCFIGCFTSLPGPSVTSILAELPPLDSEWDGISVAHCWPIKSIISLVHWLASCVFCCALFKVVFVLCSASTKAFLCSSRAISLSPCIATTVLAPWRALATCFIATSGWSAIAN